MQLTLWQNETDQTGYSYTGFIRGHKPGAILTPMPPVSSAAFNWIYQGMTVSVIMNRNSGQLIFYPTVDSYELDASNSTMWLKLPPDFELIQRRRYVRVSASIAVQLLWQEAGQAMGRQMNATSQDLSAGGMKLQCPFKLNKGQSLTLKFEPIRGQGTWTVTAQVIYCTPIEPAETQKTGLKGHWIGVQFEGLPRDKEQALIQECFRRELESRKDPNKRV